MRIALTYDLRDDYRAAGWSEVATAEFDSHQTIEAIRQALIQNGHEVDRVGHAGRLMARLLAGQRWPLVFNIAEGLRGPGRESLVPALLEQYAIPCTFGDSLALAVALHKPTAKALVRHAGLPTPDFVVVSEAEDLAAAAALGWPLFAKPVAEGTGKGIGAASLITDTDQLSRVCQTLLCEFAQPVLVERYLPGREFTVALLGTATAARVIGTFEIALRPQAEPLAYGYLNKEQCQTLVDYRLVGRDGDPVVADAQSLALAAWRLLDGRDAGRVDVRCDDRGLPQFVEVNPLAGLHPTHSDLPMIWTATGGTYPELIAAIVASALARGSPDGSRRCDTGQGFPL